MADQEKTSGSSAFLSYSRKDKEFVRKLNDGLDASGVNAWVDWEGIPLSADWMAEITRAIESADAFIFVISPDSLASEVCAEELNLGIKYNKKLVPVLYRMPKKGAAMHPKLAATNWVYLRDQDDFDTTLPKLLDAIRVDLDWVRQHTRLLQRATEWEGKGRNPSFLLQGADLSDAERWMADAAAQEDRQVLPLQVEYIQASRKGSVRRQRNLLIGVSLALVVSILLGVYAFFQRGIARENEVLARDNAATAVSNADLAATAQAVAQTNEARAVQNEAQALANENSANAQRSAARAQVFQAQAVEIYVSTLLAVDSWQREPSLQAEDILRQNITLLPLPLASADPGGEILQIELSPDGTSFVTTSTNGKACVWGMGDGVQQFCLQHGGDVTDALFVQDGQVLVTASSDGSVRLWNVVDHSELQRFDFDVVVTDVDASPDGNWLVVGRMDNMLSVINLGQGRVVSSLDQRGPVNTVGFDPGGNWVLIATQAGNVRIWRFLSDFSLSGPQHDGDAYGAYFSPDGLWLASFGEDSMARVTMSGQGGERFGLAHGDWVEDLAFSPDSSWFVTASDDNRVWVWDTRTGQERLRMRHDGFVKDVIVSPDGHWIASTGDDRTVRIWNASTGAEMMRLPLDSRGSALAFSLDGNRLIVGEASGHLSLWDISSLAARIGFLEFPQLVREAQINPSGEFLAVNSDDKHVWLMPAEQGLLLHDGTRGEIVLTADALTYQIAFSPDSSLLAVLETDRNRVLLYNLETDTTLTLQYAGHVSAVAFSPDGQQLALAGRDSGIAIWDAARGELLYTLDPAAPVYSVAFHPGGTWLLVGLRDRLAIWNVDTRAEVATFDQPGEITRVAVSDDGIWVASSTSDGTTYLGRVSAGDSFQAFFGVLRSEQALSLDFSPDNRLLAVGTSLDAHLFDLESGEEIARLPHAYAVTGVSFSNDGSRLVTVARKVVQYWEVDRLRVISTATIIDSACGRLIENFSEGEWSLFFNAEPYHLICPDLPAGGN